jgi:glycosyltransferase involved in cell wall biosynthesis
MVRDAIDRWMNDYLKRCEHVIVPSESMRAVIEEFYEFSAPITVVATGIDLRPFVTANGNGIRKERGWENDFVIISVGRLTPEKGWPTLLKGAAIAMQSIPRSRLALVGEGFEKKKLQKLTRELGIAEKVDFLGKVPFDQVANYLKAANLFAFASDTETQGLVTVEAMAAGLPVVAVDAIGTRDVVEDEVDGLLTENNAEAMAAGLLRMVSSRETLERFRAASLRKAQSMDLMKQARRLVSVYDEAIASKKANLSAKKK